MEDYTLGFVHELVVDGAGKAFGEFEKLVKTKFFYISLPH